MIDVTHVANASHGSAPMISFPSPDSSTLGTIRAAISVSAEGNRSETGDVTEQQSRSSRVGAAPAGQRVLSLARGLRIAVITAGTAFLTAAALTARTIHPTR